MKKEEPDRAAADEPHALEYESPRQRDTGSVDPIAPQKFYLRPIGFLIGAVAVGLAVEGIDGDPRHGLPGDQPLLLGSGLLMAVVLFTVGAITIGVRKRRSQMLWPTFVVWLLLGAGFWALIWGTCYTALHGPYRDGH